MINFGTLDIKKLVDQASRQHANVCKASDQIAEHYNGLVDLVKEKHAVITDDYIEPYKYPIVYLDSDRMEEIEDAHGNPVIHVWIECIDCNASGFIDIKDNERLHNDKQHLKSAKSQRASGNSMGGRDVSEKYC